MAKIEMLTLEWKNGKVVEGSPALIEEKGANLLLKNQDKEFPIYIKLEDAGKYNLEVTKEKVKPEKSVKPAKVVEPTEPEPTDNEPKSKGRNKIISAEESENIG